MSVRAEKQRLRRRRIRITGWTALSSLLVAIVGFLVYFHIVFVAERDKTLEVYRDESVEVTLVDGSVVMTPAEETATSGILYFPGARVDPFSYLYPLSDVAASGTAVVVMDPLMNMALFDQRSLDELVAVAPEITSWTLAGHSLGGVRACMLADDPRVTHLVLFASFCANDLSAADLDVLLVQGDRDGLIDTNAVKESLRLLPPGRFEERVIEGANHASFGTYGVQPGDGVSTLSAADMRSVITEIVSSWWALTRSE